MPPCNILVRFRIFQNVVFVLKFVAKCAPAGEATSNYYSEIYFFLTIYIKRLVINWVSFVGQSANREWRGQHRWLISPPPPQLTGRQNLNEWLEYFLYFWQKWIISNKLFHIFDCFFELTSILSSIDGNSKTDPSPYSLSWHEQETHLKLRSHPQQCTQSPGPENI